MLINKLDRGPSKMTPVDRMREKVHATFDNVFKPGAVGTAAVLGRGINAIGCTVVEFVKSLLSRS